MALSDEIVRKEIESWRRFAYVLREDERELFNRMIDSCYSYAAAINAMGKNEAREATLMALLLTQHKLISWLIDEIEKLSSKQ
jgi:hypothetical protein